MATTNSTVEYQGALTGNLITIEIGGKVIGLIQSLQAQEDFGLQPVSGIGQVTPVEHTPSIVRINLSCETIYISTGAALKAGGAYGQGQASSSEPPTRLVDKGATTLETVSIIPSTAVDILRGATFTITVRRLADTANDAPVRQFIDCSYSGGSISFQKHQIVMQSATFMAIDYTGRQYNAKTTS